MLRLRPSTVRPAFALAGLAVLLFAGCSSGRLPASDDRAVAQFAGETLTLDEFETRYALSVGGREAAAQDSFPAYADFLSRYVDFRLKVQQARDLGLDEDTALVREINDYRAQLAKPYFVEREVLDGIIRDLYDKQKEELRASHILLRVDENAAPEDTLAAYAKLSAIRDSVIAGADFAALAVRHSEDPSAARNEGDLGYFTGGRMIDAFERQAYTTPVGEVSPVFRTSFGYHILRVADRRAASPEISASHILIRLGPEATAADSTQARELAASLRQRILAGEDFATLARQYSDDQASGQNGGDLGFFSRVRMVEPFANAAYDLENVGDVSDIVETRFGYHLIKLTGRKEMPTYDEAYSTLKPLAERLPRTAVRRQAVGQEFRAEVGSTLDEALVRRATAAYPADSLLRGAVVERFGTYSDSTFATIGDSTYALGGLSDYLRQTRVAPAPDQFSQLLALADDYLNEQAVELAAYRLEDRDPEFRRIMQDYADGVLLFRISEDSVWNAAARDSIGLLVYYSQRIDDYQFPERHRVIGFYSRNDSLLSVAAAALDAGKTPAEIDAMMADAEQDVRIDTVFVSKTNESLFDQALALEVGQRTEVLPYQSRKAILYLDAIEPPRTMKFEEARAQIVAQYQDLLDTQLRERLRRKYNAELYPERLRTAFDDVMSASVPTDTAQ
ncbi:MAG: peptidylprolyl isomerase [Rhodothermales bacterium]